MMLRLFRYRLPFRKPFRFSGREYLEREGFILEYREDDIVAYGEVAPLPGFSTESLDQVTEVLKLNREALELALQDGTASQLLDSLDIIHDFPSLSFGVDTLIHDLSAKKSGLSLSSHLFSQHLEKVTCNAVLPIGSQDEVLSTANHLIKEGFQTLKIKVGEIFSHEKEILQAVRQKYPNIKIRIDVNESWEVEEAVKYLNSLEYLNIEYCEQPVKKGDLEGLKQVKDRTEIFIAADESIRNKKDVPKLLKSEAVNVLILKPILIGSFKNIFVTKQMAESHNIEVVFTTSLDSAIARATTIALASGLGSQRFAHGLATGQFLSNDIGRNSWLNNNLIHLPDAPGLGVSVDYKVLEEI